jgi:AcrR family transcriptional regulator
MARKPKLRTNAPDALKARVLDVAAELFQSRGYHATGMADIVKGAGVTSGGLHHHFPTKKAIGLAVLRERVRPAVAGTWIEPVARAKSAAEGVAAVFAAITAELDARRAVQGCPLNNLTLELSLADKDFRTEMAKLFAQWEAALAQRIQADGLRDADDTAVVVIAAYSGAMAMAKAEQSSTPLKICGKRLAQMLRTTG